jgi:hypothetical protein
MGNERLAAQINRQPLRTVRQKSLKRVGDRDRHHAAKPAEKGAHQQFRSAHQSAQMKFSGWTAVKCGY